MTPDGAAGGPAPVSAGGAQVPVDAYILKVASRCNLNCGYCYMYNMGDESYRGQPFRMSSETVSALLSRVADYSRARGVDRVTFIFHGGEPLLAGKDFFHAFAARAADRLGDDITPIYALETNGTLLTPAWLDLFHEHSIGFGISLDGPPAVHDTWRVNHAGQGSHGQVLRGLEMTRADRRMDRLFGGVLAVIDLTADPLEVYRHFRELGLHRCDFLLPDGTRDHPPRGLGAGTAATPYADWLIRLFDAWFGGQDTSLSIRIFDDLIRMIFGKGFGVDAMGGGANNVLVIETDGGYEPIDVLRICRPGMTGLGMNVHAHSVAEACADDLVRLYQRGAEGLCGTCRRCPVVTMCGGGYLPHRYETATGFDNPSVYCRDLMKLITHVRDRVLATIPDALRGRLGLHFLGYEEALASLTAAGAAGAARG
jgi:uncharacterized protein